MRKLASIQTITSLNPIPNADKLELARVLSWNCVVKKGEFKVGEKIVYIEVDSFLPVKPEWEFLRKSSFKSNPMLGDGFRVKTAKLRGQISQGLVVPISILSKDYPVNTDVSDLLGIKKWELPEVSGSMGTAVSGRPYNIPKTDETRIQSLDSLRTQLLGKSYYISTKMDGTSITAFYINNEFGVCSRNQTIKDDGTSFVYEYMKKHCIPEKLSSLNRNIVLQGEMCGPGIQKNRLSLKEYTWYLFNVLDGDTMELLPFDDFIKITESLDILHVPVEETGNSFNYTVDELIERAKGKYPSGQNKEGIVVRPLVPVFNNHLQKELSFKVLNNDFLLKE